LDRKTVASTDLSLAVVTITGIAARLGSLFWCSRNSQPSITGIIKSRMMASGRFPARITSSA